MLSHKRTKSKPNMDELLLKNQSLLKECKKLGVVIPDVPSLHQLNFDGGSHIVSMSEKGLHKPASEFEKRRPTGNTKSHKKAMKENHRKLLIIYNARLEEAIVNWNSEQSAPYLPT
eukprot:EG_transcript_50241